MDQSMMVNFASGVDVVFGILGMIALIAAAAAVARSALVKAQLEGLRGDRDDQKERIDRLEADVERLARENVDLKAKNAVLEKLVTGRDQLERIEKTVNEIRAKVAA